MKENLVLIGMPGSGKTSVGKILAERLGFVFADLDEEIAKAAGRSIPEIFAEEGEEGFRQRETACAREAASRTGQVIATGGSAKLVTAQCRSRIRHDPDLTLKGLRHLYQLNTVKKL